MLIKIGQDFLVKVVSVPIQYPSLELHWDWLLKILSSPEEEITPFFVLSRFIKIQDEQGWCVYLQKHEILRDMVDHHKQVQTHRRTVCIAHVYLWEMHLIQELHTFRELNMCTLQIIKFLWNHMYFNSWPQTPTKVTFGKELLNTNPQVLAIYSCTNLSWSLLPITFWYYLHFL